MYLRQVRDSGDWRSFEDEDGAVPLISNEPTLNSRLRLKIAMAVAIVADVVQMIVLPLVIEGAVSPADDVLDACACVALSLLLGWHWEFLPSALGKLVPGLDIVPLWTMAVANVYRKTKPLPARREGVEAARPVGRGSTTHNL